LVLIRKNGNELSLASVPALIHKHKPTITCTPNGGKITIKISLSDTVSDGTGEGYFDIAAT
jgi:nitrogen-specific signal transduction histidine kinase